MASVEAGAPVVGAPMSLRRAVAWTTTGNGLYLACQYAMVMALAKFGSPTLVGQFYLALAITAPVVILSQMQLRQLQVTDVRGEFEFADYFATRLATSALALVTIGAITVGAGYAAETVAIVTLVGLAKVFESLSDVAHGHLQRDERMDRVAASLAVKGALSVLLFAGVLWLGHGLLGAVTALALVWGATLVAWDLPMVRRVLAEGKRLLAWHPSVAARLAMLGFQPGLTAGLASLSGNIPRYFLEAQRGHDAVGFFAVAAAPLALLSLLTGAVGQAALARAAVYFQGDRMHAFRRLALQVGLLQVGLAGAGAVAFALGGEWLLGVLFTRDYAAFAPVLVTMAAGMAVGGLAAFGSMVLAAGRMFGLQFLNVVVMVLLQLPTCYLLVGTAGVTGAGWAELVRYVLAAAFLHGVGVVMYRQHARGVGEPG